MKRGCLIFFLVVVIVSVGAAGVAFYQADKQFGLWAAAPVSHETLAEPATRLRVALRLEQLTGYLIEALPPDVAVPGWIPLSLDQAVPYVLPHEMAILGHTDYRNSNYTMLFFVNERRGGPFLREMVNQSDVFAQISEINWDPERLRLRQRGVLTLAGSMPIPEGLEDLVLQHWTPQAPETLLRLEDGHLLEVALDNRNGDALPLWAAFAVANGDDFERLLQEPVGQAILQNLPEILTLRLHANLLDQDTLKVNLRIEATPNAGPSLQFMLGAFVIPTLQQTLRNDYGVTMKGDAAWNATEGALLGDYTLTGFRARVLEALRQLHHRAA